MMSSIGSRFGGSDLPLPRGARSTAATISSECGAGVPTSRFRYGIDNSTILLQLSLARSAANRGQARWPELHTYSLPVHCHEPCLQTPATFHRNSRQHDHNVGANLVDATLFTLESEVFEILSAQGLQGNGGT